MSVAPVLLPGGQVLLAGKSRIIYLLDGATSAARPPGSHPGGQRHAIMGSACSDDIDGGAAAVGITVYLPCLAGIIAVRATNSPPAPYPLWSSGVGGGPPIVAAGLVWTVGQNGGLYGLDPATGRVRQQVTIGVPANHFPTPSAGDGLLARRLRRQCGRLRRTDPRRSVHGHEYGTASSLQGLHPARLGRGAYAHSQALHRRGRLRRGRGDHRARLALVAAAPRTLAGQVRIPRPPLARGVAWCLAYSEEFLPERLQGLSLRHD